MSAKEKSQNRIQLSNQGFLIFLIFCSIFSCIEPEVGCLDVNATNFDVGADDPCTDDCCTYPTISLSFRHIIIPPDQDTTISFKYETYYPTNDGDHEIDTFTIDRIRYFISNFRLVKTNGEEINVIDSTLFDIDGTEVYIKDNFAKVDRDIFTSNTIGTILENGSISSVKFKVGLEENVLKIDSTSLANFEGLDVSGDTISYDADLGYIPIMVAFNKDTISTTETTFVRIFEFTEVELFLDEVFELDAGFGVQITVQVDYLEWFRNINLPEEGDPSNASIISNTIVENIANSFTIFEIKN